MLSKEIMQCIEDMSLAAQDGKISLDACVRAYDLLDQLVDASLGGLAGPAEMFCERYYSLESELKEAYDEQYLQAQADLAIKPFMEALETAAEKARKASDLHEAAKKTFEIWQTGGFFARQRALRKLRSLAGFRLESNRIGNYVAKTFDLMNEANRDCSRAQQDLFAANVSYKIMPGLYSRIASVLQIEPVVRRIGCC